MMLPLSLGTLEAENHLLFGVTVALLVIASVSISLRTLVRISMLRQWGWDDAAICFAHLLFIATCALTFALIENQKVIEVTKEDPSVARIKRLVRFHNASYCLTMIIAKLSLGVFFLTIFNHTSHRIERFLVFACMAIPSFFGLVYLGMTLFSCSVGVSQLLVDNCDIQPGYTSVSITWSTLNSTSDILLSCLAVWALARAQKLSFFAKFSASALLILGTTGGIASIMRLLVQVVSQREPLQGVVLARWSNTEAGLCISAASLVTLRPLFQRAVSRPLSRLSGAWNWSASNNSKGHTSTSVSSFTGKSRKSRKHSVAPTLLTNRSTRSARRISGDAFVEYLDANKSHSVARACSEAEGGAARMPSTIADPGGLLTDVEAGHAEKAGDIVVTMEVEVTDKPRTKSVCFGPGTSGESASNGGGGGGGGGFLGLPTRPQMVRTKSSRV